MITTMKKLFCTPSAQEIARRELLEAQRGVEYHASMVDFNAKRIARLEAFSKQQEARHA